MANYGCTCNGSVAGTTDTGCNCCCNENGTVGGVNMNTCNCPCGGTCGGTCGSIGGVGSNSCQNGSLLGCSDSTEHLLIIIAIVLLLLAMFCTD
ncbi:MAG: hypothetical protein E7599_03505 [Ruminococcaceae bacterium]|nr:hypothetical protein [Oscillospiraceae bacterium]